jgi:hypothetical protein
MRLRILLFVLAALLVWIALDLAVPVHGNLRQFDAHAVARLETAMWRSYYDHRPVRLFRELAELLRTQYHLPLWQSYMGAYHAAQAAVVFQRGHGRGDYRRALPDIGAFYRLIRRASDVPFDPDQVSRVELEWWIVHREGSRHAAGDLERVLAELQAGIYRQSASRFAEHARTRAEAMRLRDALAAAGGVTEPGWQRIAGLLDSSWGSLRAAVARPPFE